MSDDGHIHRRFSVVVHPGTSTVPDFEPQPPPEASHTSRSETIRESILDDHEALRHHQVHRFEIATQNSQRKSSSDPGARVIDAKPARDEVYELGLLSGDAHEHHVLRFDIIVHPDAFLARSVALLALIYRGAHASIGALTRLSWCSRGDVGSEFVAEVGATRVLVERVGTIETSRSGDPIGHPDAEQLPGIDARLTTVCGLS